MPLSFYTVFIGTILSIVSLSYLAIKEYKSGESRTLSELGGLHDQALQQFRAILWICGTLFTITMLFFIAPRLQSPFMYVIWLATYACEVLLGIFPAHKGIKGKLHNIFAFTMAAGFLITSIYFTLRLDGIYQTIMWVILVIFTILALLALADKKRFLFYELAFIYLSHISICVAALSLR